MRNPYSLMKYTKNRKKRGIISGEDKGNFLKEKREEERELRKDECRSNNVNKEGGGG